MASFRNLYKNQLLQNKLMDKYEFTEHFNDILRNCELEMKRKLEAPREMQSFESSRKSKKTVESLKKAPLEKESTKPKPVESKSYFSLMSHSR